MIRCNRLWLYVVVLGLVASPLFAQEVARSWVHPLVVEETEGGAATEFFVVFRPAADLEHAWTLSTKMERGRYVFQALQETAQASQREVLALLRERGVEHRPFYIVNAVLVKGDRLLVDELAARPEVLRLEPNPEIQHPLPTPSPAGSAAPIGVEWGVQRTNAPGLWDLGFTGESIVVGGQDTGIDWDHPALKNQYRGWDGENVNHDYSWHDSIHGVSGNPCGSDSSEPCDDHGHGTHTVGTVVGDDGGSNQIGMAPGAKWIGCRNMDRGAGTPARYLECFEFFLAPYPVGGTPAEGDPDKAPHVTNNSWTCPPAEGCSWDTISAALAAQRAAGIMTVVSAGNDGPSCATVQDPPAIYDASYTVGSTTSSDVLSSFSSRGPAAANVGNPTLLKPDIVAPGSGIRSALPGGGYGSMSGTSMAGPHVAGAVALLWHARPELKNDVAASELVLNDLATRLTGVTEGCGGDYVNGPNNSWGHGLLNLDGVIDTSITLVPVAAMVTEVNGDGNGVVEKDEIVRLGPTWHNTSNWVADGVTGAGELSAGGTFLSDDAGYGTIEPGQSASCEDSLDCYVVMVSGSRPATHWDLVLEETVSTGDQKSWLIHVGESFADIDTGDWAYMAIETVLHNGLTAGCGGGLYCPGQRVSRWQMGVFLAASMLGGAEPPLAGTVPGMGPYNCSPGGSSVFTDIEPSDAGCWAIHYIAARGLTAGCGGGKYCPWNTVDRWQMGVFLAAAMAGDGTLPTAGTVPGMGAYDCSPGGQSVFGDLAPEDPACAAIHYIATHGVTAGCGGGNYCPADPVLRDQMAVFLAAAFDFSLASQ